MLGNISASNNRDKNLRHRSRSQEEVALSLKVTSFSKPNDCQSTTPDLVANSPKPSEITVNKHNNRAASQSPRNRKKYHRNDELDENTVNSKSATPGSSGLPTNIVSTRSSELLNKLKLSNKKSVHFIEKSIRRTNVERNVNGDGNDYDDDDQYVAECEYVNDLIKKKNKTSSHVKFSKFPPMFKKRMISKNNCNTFALGSSNKKNSPNDTNKNRSDFEKFGDTNNELISNNINYNENNEHRNLSNSPSGNNGLFRNLANFFRQSHRKKKQLDDCSVGLKHRPDQSNLEYSASVSSNGSSKLKYCC